MIFEELSFQFDIEKLQSHFRENVLPLQPHMIGSFFGGWSVLSSNGSYLDGWASGEKLYEPNFMPNHTPQERAAAIGIKPSTSYIVPTEVCTGYLAEVIQTIQAAGLKPCRARLSLLKAGGQSKKHQDAKSGQYAVRLHVPIITNSGCTFEVFDEEPLGAPKAAHLAANGRAYALKVDRMHQIFNRGDSDRVHLIMDIRDEIGFTKFHRFNAT